MPNRKSSTCCSFFDILNTMIISTIKNYSPSSIHEIVYPNNEVQEMVFAYASGALETPLLLYGSSGTGKSLIQRLLPNAIEKKEAHFQKIRCSDLKNASDIHDLYGRNKMFNKNFSVNDQRFNYWSCPNSPDTLTFLNKVIGFNDIGS